MYVCVCKKKSFEPKFRIKFKWFGLSFIKYLLANLSKNAKAIIPQFTGTTVFIFALIIL